MTFHLDAQAAVGPAGECQFPGGKPAIFEFVEPARRERRRCIGRDDGPGTTESRVREIDPAATVAEIG
jgi:hypothetical protein